MKLGRSSKTKTTKAPAKFRERGRSTASEVVTSDAPRKRYTRKDEPENHTRLASGRKGHVTY